MHENCLWIHFGIPRGTSSRAHGICLGQFEHGPPPLRNQRYPDRASSYVIQRLVASEERQEALQIYDGAYFEVTSEQNLDCRKPTTQLAVGHLLCQSRQE